ncbi:MAG: FlgD immunoglobulin-like domain containing protein [Candidatus Krumholzibacteriia bacterium]
MTRPEPSHRCHPGVAFSIPRLLGLAWLLLVLKAAPAAASIDFAILPAEPYQEPGDTITVELTVTGAGAEFNAYDAVVAYDPERLLFMGMTPIGLQEGPLMTEACSQRFHLFSIAPDSTRLEVNHSLLCAGVSITGPGVVYRLAFRCRDLVGATRLDLVEGTAMFDVGIHVDSVKLSGSLVRIGTAPSAVPGPTAPLAPPRACPNPFNPRTQVSFSLVSPAWTRLRIHALDGRLVRELHRGFLPAGTHRVSWDATDRTGRAVASGRYHAVLEADGRRSIGALTLVR